MMRLHISAILFITFFTLQAQQLVQDENALRILEKAAAQYDNYDSYEIDFELVIEHGEMDPESQKGNMIQQGDHYYMDTPAQAIYIDGSSSWLFLKNSNEVQINDYDPNENEGIISPNAILSEFSSDEYDYMISNIGREDGQKLTQIELKPLTEDSDFSKIRFTFVSSEDNLKRIKVFNRDGSRYTLYIRRLETNKKYDPTIFTFDQDENPDVYIEDLRID